MEIFVFLTLAIFFVLFLLAMTDQAVAFGNRSIRFTYRFGIILYSRTFIMHPRSNKHDIPRWKIEHWMTASGFSHPMAEEDGEKRYILMEFTEFFLTFYPMLMRATVSWDNKDNNVIVRGYATWTYFIGFVFLVVFSVVMFFMPLNEAEYICFGAPLLIYLLWCSHLYSKQSKRFYSIGEKVAEYLSADYQE